MISSFTELAPQLDENTSNLLDLLESVYIDPSTHYEKPPIVLSIDETPICTFGNFSVFIGKAKSKKTFLMVMLLAACIQNPKPLVL